MEKKFDRDYPLQIVQREIPLGYDLEGVVSMLADDYGIAPGISCVGEFTQVKPEKLPEKQKDIHDMGLTWTQLEQEDGCVLIFTRDITKASDAIGLRARSLGISGPTLSANEWDRMLQSYGVEEKAREAFVNRMIRKSGTRDKPFDVVEGILDLPDNQFSLVLSNISMISTLNEKLAVGRDLLMELLVSCASTWDKNRHPAFLKYAYSKITNEIKEDRRVVDAR